LALLGASGDLDALADMTEEAFAVALETARQEKADRDARIAKDRADQAAQAAELARLQKEEADRIQREADALEQREREAQEAADKAERDAKIAHEEAQAEADRIAEEERLAALRPEREKVAAWAHAALDAMPDIPEVTDAALLRTLRNTVEGIRHSLIELGRVDG
jgi:chromosome segregation ATPase